MGRAIFISYRRDDSEGEAGRLFDDLVRTFGEDSVFMDVAGISPGIDFRKAIDDNVASCGVLLAMIGPQWAAIQGSSGQRRLDDENDFVRLEIASALARKVAVIPVLVHEAKMPHPDQLPENLKDLAYHNSVEITHARWNSDVQLLTRALGQYVSPSSYSNTEPVHATVAVQLPPPNAPSAKSPAAGKSSKTPIFLGLGAAALLAIAAFAYFGMHGATAVPASTAAAQPSAAPSAAPVSTAAAQPASVSPAAPVPAAATPASTALQTGSWVNLKLKIRDNMPRRLDITGSGDQLSFHMWGACPDCDWGVQPATARGGQWVAQWTFAKPLANDPPGRVTEVAASPDGDQLHLTVRSRMPDNRFMEGKWTFVRSSGQ